MEKTETKRTKRKTLQITYPAPYSQSWNPDVLPVLMKNSVGRSTSLFHRSRRPLQSPRAWSQQFPDRPDPTAPHLKYGVFRNRRGSAPTPRPIPKRMSLPEKQIKPNLIPGHVIKVPQDLISKKNSTQTAQKKPERKKICVHLMRCTLPPGAAALSEAGGLQPASSLAGRRPLPRSQTASSVVGGQKYSSKKRQATAATGNSKFPPVFVIRSKDKNNSRQLSQSKIMHMDIKPKRIATLSPSFCPSPNFRTLSRKLSPRRSFRLDAAERE